MRLLDKVLSHGPRDEREARLKMASKSTFGCVVVDEIARHYFENDQQLWSPEDYPYCVSPWPFAFLEWHQPDRIKMPSGWVNGNPSHQMGCWVTADSDPDAVPKTLRYLRTLSEMPDVVDVSGATRVIAMQPVLFAASKLACPKIVTFAFTTEEGRVVNRIATGPDMGLYIKELGRDEAMRFFDSTLHILGLAFTFMNCKNVSLENHTDALQPPAKIRRRLKLPVIKRHTLNIGGHSTTRYPAKKQKQFGVMPFHLCRGHFANYTEEKPLFGRLVGKFWISAHMRGKRDRGEVVKDYAIEGVTE